MKVMSYMSVHSSRTLSMKSSSMPPAYFAPRRSIHQAPAPRLAAGSARRFENRLTCMPRRNRAVMMSSTFATSALADVHAAKLLPMLVAMESIRSELGAEQISVPGIVVAGAQSAGKSSVLESLSGINLPRGETITTRVPLFIRLAADPSISASFAEIATSPGMDGKERIDDLSLVGQAITGLTKELAGEGGHVKNKPIYLNVTHRSGPTMTLIDLPGITHIAEDGQVCCVLVFCCDVSPSSLSLSSCIAWDGPNGPDTPPAVKNRQNTHSRKHGGISRPDSSPLALPPGPSVCRPGSAAGRHPR